MEIKQIKTTYTFYGVDYDLHITQSHIEDSDNLYRTTYKFKFTPDDPKYTVFYCITSEYPEVVFSYVIDAYRKYGPEEWKKHLKFDYVTKALSYDGEIMPV